MKNIVRRGSELTYTVLGISVILFISIVGILTEIVKLGLVYVCYGLGDILSRTTMRMGRGYGYRLYSKLMLISSDLDTNDRLWKTPCKEHPEIEQACCHQRKK